MLGELEFALPAGASPFGCVGGEFEPGDDAEAEVSERPAFFLFALSEAVPALAAALALALGVAYPLALGFPFLVLGVVLALSSFGRGGGLAAGAAGCVDSAYRADWVSPRALFCRRALDARRLVWVIVARVTDDDKWFSGPPSFQQKRHSTPPQLCCVFFALWRDTAFRLRRCRSGVCFSPLVLRRKTFPKRFP